MTTSEVFVRKASGLVREVGLLSGIGMNISTGATVGVPFLAVPYFFWFATGGNFFLAVAIAMVGAMAVSSVYAHFSAAMPRSGGDYIFLGRTIHPLLGFVVNWIMASLFVFWIPFTLLWQIDISKQIAFIMGPSTNLAWSNIMQDNFLIFIFLAVQLIIVFLAAIPGMRFFAQIQRIIWILALVVAGMVVVGFAQATPNFTSIFNTWSLQYVPTEPDMYNKIISNAAAAGFSFSTHEGPWMEQTLTFAALWFSYIAPYTVATSYIAGEVKSAESGVRQHILVESAVVFQNFMMVLLGWTYINMVGLRFLSSVGYLGSVEGLPLSVFGWWTMTATLPKWAALYWFVCLFLSMLLAILSYIPVASRCIFAWSFDRLLPTRLAHVSDRWKTPTYVLGLLFIICLIFLYGAIYVNLWAYIAAVGMWTLINLMIICVAGIVFPFMRKDMYEQMPLKTKIAGVPLLTLISIVGLAVAVGTTTSYFTNPPFAATLGISAVTIGSSIIVYALPITIFFVARAFWKRKGIDLEIAFKQIPPA